MANEDMAAKLRGEVQSVDAATLLPHQRRGALVMLRVELDLIDVAVAIGSDDAEAVAGWIERGDLVKPTLGDMADWCVDPAQQFQFVIVQPFVLAQPLPKAAPN